MESETDSSGPSRDTTDRSINNKPGIRLSLELEEYDMTKERKMIIFNHYDDYVDPYPELKQKPSPRHGTNNDVAALEKTFKDLNFDVTTHDDKNHDVILGEVRKLTKHRNVSCVGVCVLTHGTYGGFLCARDKMYNLNEIINVLQNAPELVGKPKLVIVQACRGGLMDPGKYTYDSVGTVIWLPTHIDTLILRSSVEGFGSIRDVSQYGIRSDDEGSWLIQDLCRVLKAKHSVLDVLKMTTLVTSLVAKRASYSDLDPEIDGKKQTPETRSTLTKILRL